MKSINRRQAALFLLCIPLIAFWKILFAQPDYSFFTSNDAAQHWYPWYQYIARWMHVGFLPLWDTDLQSGRPLLGEMRPGVLYPLNLIFFRLFSVKDGIGLLPMDLYIVSEVVLASLFQYRLARHLSLSRFASLLSAVVYGYSGYVVENATWQIAIFNGVIWLPLLVLLFLRAGGARTGIERAFWLLSSGVVFGVIVLAGHVQPPVHAALSLALVAFYPGFWPGFRQSAFAGVGRSAMRLGACLVTGAIVASPQLLVALEYGRRSLRWLGWDDLAPVAGMGRIPYAWGGHFERSHFQDVFTAVNPGTWAGSDYFGAAPILLAVVAFLLASGAGVRLFKVLLILSILLCLGELSIFHGPLYQLIPLMDKVRQPSRAIFLVHFSIATLAGFGADVLGRSLRAREKRAHHQLALILVWVSSFSAALICVAGMLAVLLKGTSMTDERLEWTLRFSFLLLVSATIFYFRQIGRLRLGTFRVFLLAVVAFDLFSFFSYAILSRYGYNNKNNFFPEIHYARNEAVDFLKQKARGSLFRVEVVEDALPPNSGMVHGYQEITGGMATGLADYHRFRGLDTGPHSVIPRLLNRRYLVSRSVIPGFDEVVHGPPKVFEDRNALPRATWMPGAIVLDSWDSVADALRRPEFDPRAAVLVTPEQSTSIPRDLLVSGPRPNPESAHDYVRVTAFEPDRISLSCDAPRKGIVLLSELVYPGWLAMIDGARVPVITANCLLRAVVVEKGRHTIEFVYRPRLFRTALGASLAVFLLTGILGVFLLITRLPRHQAKP